MLKEPGVEAAGRVGRREGGDAGKVVADPAPQVTGSHEGF